MPEGDLRDLYGVMKRVSSGRWRSGLRLTAEKDEEKLQEKYGNFWLEKSGKTRWKPPSVAEQAGVASETVNEAESGAGDDDDGSREMPARPVAAAVSETNEVGVAKGLEELLREAEAELEGREVFVVEAAEAATAVLADEVEAAETEEVDEVAIEETEILWDENQDEDETRRRIKGGSRTSAERASAPLATSRSTAQRASQRRVMPVQRPRARALHLCTHRCRAKLCMIACVSRVRRILPWRSGCDWRESAQPVCESLCCESHCMDRHRVRASVSEFDNFHMK